jgi:hypothetical protein
MQAGKDYAVTVTVRNAGEQTWPATGVGDKSANMVSVSYHWLPATGDNPVVFEGARTPVPTDIAPGQSFTNNSIYVLAPSSPGSYRLQMTMIQEMVAWFDQQGASTVTVPVTVR